MSTAINELDRNKLHIGDIVYACAYGFNSDGIALLYHQKPVRGILSDTDVSADKSYIPSPNPAKNPRYFIPFKDNGKGNELAWSKSVRKEHRHYAASEESCVQVYNALIQRRLNYVEKWAAEQKEHCLSNMIPCASACDTEGTDHD